MKAKIKSGRPSKFGEIDMGVVEACVKKGFTDEEISKMLKITCRTFNNWKKEHSDFFQSLKDWKKEADAEVEKSLYERAKGYKCDDTHVAVIKNEVVLTPLAKHYPPDPTSMIFWLKNRQPEKWRDRTEITGKDGKDLINEVKITIVK